MSGKGIVSENMILEALEENITDNDSVEFKQDDDGDAVPEYFPPENEDN